MTNKTINRRYAYKFSATITWLLLASVLVACQKSSESVDQPAIVQNSKTQQLWEECSKGRASTTLDSLSLEQGLEEMDKAQQACDTLRALAPKESSKIDSLSGENWFWRNRFDTLLQVRTALQSRKFSLARKQIAEKSKYLKQSDIDSWSSAIDEAESKFAADWIPWRLDVAGLERGDCQRSQLAHSLDDVKRWADEEVKSGYMQLHQYQRNDKSVRLVYVDTLLKARAVRTFYSDMDACHAED